MLEHKTETQPKLSKLWVDSSGKLTDLTFAQKEIEVVKPFELKDKYLTFCLTMAFVIANIAVYTSFQYFTPNLINVGTGEKLIIYIATIIVSLTFLMLFFSLCYLLVFFAKVFIWESKMQKK